MTPRDDKSRQTPAAPDASNPPRVSEARSLLATLDKAVLSARGKETRADHRDRFLAAVRDLFRDA